VEGPAVSFCPSDLTAPYKSHHPPLVIPSAAEGPAVRPGSRTKTSVPLVLPQNRHPERSAPQIYPATQRLWRGVEEPVLSVAEGTSAVLILPMPFGAFQPPKPDDTIYCDTHLIVTATHTTRACSAYPNPPHPPPCFDYPPSWLLPSAVLQACATQAAAYKQIRRSVLPGTSKA
jgi:hypothetical protein